MPASGQAPCAGDAIALFGEQAVALEAVKQRPGLGVVADPQPAADRTTAGAWVLGEVAKRPAAQHRRQPDGAAITGVMAVSTSCRKSLQTGIFLSPR